jgi:hypothetical protein
MTCLEVLQALNFLLDDPVDGLVESLNLFLALGELECVPRCIAILLATTKLSHVLTKD